MLNIKKFTFFIMFTIYNYSSTIITFGIHHPIVVVSHKRAVAATHAVFIKLRLSMIINVQI